ncbi:NaeI family type II restriction endonuclease [Amycolatopsis suaedae]|uniref:Restriction endonuclease n=1 Tax=Amycolatopsis suaedae TaxID=2510978 RepID=A0A4Q7J579_9PSEU|nr:NaeI family type II restriction endonuclease [Amycolatopsis suaedae]RZQ61988.1 restriction endonuclease [Amycolatopsis suaedae]
MSEDLVLFGPDSPVEVEVDATPAHTSTKDPALAEIVNWFRGHRDLKQQFGSILRQSIDEVLDGQRTGRYDIDLTEKTEKTYLGTKVEIVTRAAFQLPRGAQMDYAIAGHDVDSKFSLRGSWSIPTEAVGHLCLLTSANDHKGTFDVGLIRVTPEVLNKGRNKDQKTTITAAAKERVVWLARHARLPLNLLLSLPDNLVGTIVAPRSGQQRINQLLRNVQCQIIDRTTAMTVARQADGLKRCRDARPQLAPEGIVVLGHQNQSPLVARALGLPVPTKGTFLSVRLTTVDSAVPGRPTVTLPEGIYAVAKPDDPVTPAPTIRY